MAVPFVSLCFHPVFPVIRTQSSRVCTIRRKPLLTNLCLTDTLYLTRGRLLQVNNLDGSMLLRAVSHSPASEIYQVTGPVERFAGQIASHGYVVGTYALSASLSAR